MVIEIEMPRYALKARHVMNHTFCLYVPWNFPWPDHVIHCLSGRQMAQFNVEPKVIGGEYAVSVIGNIYLRGHAKGPTITRAALENKKQSQFTDKTQRPADCYLGYVKVEISLECMASSQVDFIKMVWEDIVLQARAETEKRLLGVWSRGLRDEIIKEGERNK